MAGHLVQAEEHRERDVPDNHPGPEGQREEREKRVLERRGKLLYRLIEEGEITYRASQPDSSAPKTSDTIFFQDFPQIIAPLSREWNRLVLDAFLGPIVVPPRKRSERKGLTLNWVHFPIAYGPKWREKQEVADFLLRAKDQNTGSARFLFPRDLRILLATGATCFHVAMAIARMLRRSIEEDSDVVFEDEPFREIHTDSFEAARLLAPLAIRPTAPQIYLAGCLVSKKGHPIGKQDAPSFLVDPGAPASKKREIDVLVTSCRCIDLAGGIYTDNAGEDKETVTGYLSEAKSYVFVVATSDKLGPIRSSVAQAEYKIGGRSFYLITDKQPTNNFTTPVHRDDPNDPNSTIPFKDGYYPEGKLASTPAS